MQSCEFNQSRADLSGCNLADTDFSHALLDEANLMDADLSLAHSFSFASLYGSFINTPGAHAFLRAENAEI
ncbi:pentapeptide repeat-containing protein [Rufibacter roseolus]|uniref:pentapeptide repeat-containing protein n=1 Tax=Rufibacter roseolus TaxID=2817375 RepID=UPI003743B8FE